MTQSKSFFQRWRGLWPGRMHRFGPRLAASVDLLLLDLGLLRLPFNRPVEVVPGIWRSNQPTPWRLKALKRRGFKSVLNLRGEGHSGSFHLEQYYCQKLGLTLHSVKLSSRRPPTIEQLEAVLRILAESPKPLLLHCKSGADRAGLVAALACLQAGRSTQEAQKQLSLRYLHIRSADTGIMDFILEQYEQAQIDHNLTFQEWLETQYDRNQLMQAFKPSGPISWVLSRVFRRE